MNFNPFPNITTGRLNLRKIDSDDVNEIFFLRSDSRVLKYLDGEPVKSLDDALKFIKLINEMEAKNDCITWGITLKRNNKLIGTICFWNIKPEHYRAEVGYVLHPDYHRKGIMQEAMDEVLKYGFNVMKLHSIEADVSPQNIDSIKLLERNNFIKEAHFKENYHYDGKFLDTAVYSLIISQWIQK
jgi:ribosomal-protein-alanine N-acetyltransferase